MDDPVGPLGPPDRPNRFFGPEFAAALAVVEDARRGGSRIDIDSDEDVGGGARGGGAGRWQDRLRELHKSEGGALSNAVYAYLVTLTSDDERLGFVSGLQVGLLMATVLAASTDTRNDE